jgi:hypothetical protein
VLNALWLDTCSMAASNCTLRLSVCRACSLSRRPVLWLAYRPASSRAMWRFSHVAFPSSQKDDRELVARAGRREVAA